MYSAAELKKKVKNRCAKRSLFRLTIEETFGTFKERLLCNIMARLKPPTVEFNMYNISYTFKRTSGTSFSLCDENDYKFLIDCTRNGKSTITEIFTIVHEIPKRVGS